LTADAQRGSAAIEGLTTDYSARLRRNRRFNCGSTYGRQAPDYGATSNADGADIMNKPKKHDGEPQIDTDETQMGKECFFDR